VTDKTGQLRFPQLVDIETLSRHLGVGERHIRRLVAERRIPYVKWGHLVRFDLEEVLEWLEAARRPARGRA